MHVDLISTLTVRAGITVNLFECGSMDKALSENCHREDVSRLLGRSDLFSQL